MSRPPALRCEIFAPRSADAAALGAIARTCARDLGQPLALDFVSTDAALREPVLTLHLPAELAASQHQIWCLACRLACFCPHARISVLVLGTQSGGRGFTPRQTSRHDSAA